MSPHGGGPGDDDDDDDNDDDFDDAICMQAGQLILPAYFYSLTSLVKTHFWMKNRDITCVWADTLSIRIFSMRRIRIRYPFFFYPMKKDIMIA